MIDGVTFRRATLADEPALLRVLLAANDHSLRRTGRISPHALPRSSEAFEEVQQRFAGYQRYANAAGATWLAEAEGQSIAFARVIRWPPAAELTEAMVLPHWQDSGLGAALLERAFGSRQPPAGELRIIRINATTQAVGLYSRFGVAPIQIEYGVSVDQAAIRNRAEAAAKGTRITPLLGDPWVDVLDREVLGFARPDLHRFWLASRPAVAVERESVPIGYCYTGSELGPAAARSAEDLIVVVAAGLLASHLTDRVGFSLCGANLALFRWLEPARPRLFGLGVLGANQAMPSLDRYLLAQPDFTL